MNATKDGMKAGGGCWRLHVVAVAMLLAACGSGGGDATPPEAPDLAGVWAGTWQGSDPLLGAVAGTWEAEFTQSGSALTGSGTLLGDVDCMNGLATGTIDTQSHLSGTLDRSPCAANPWLLTALDTGLYTARGAWTQPATGAQGSLGGQRIAVPGGPRVRSVHPPAGGPGTVVTIAGERLAAPDAQAPLRFGGALQPTLLSASTTRWVARAPAAAVTGPVQVATAGGYASGPLMFGVEVASPRLSADWTLALNGSPTALAFSRDGRKLFVAERHAGGGAVAVVHALAQQTLARTAIDAAVPLALATSPDGRRLYAAVAGRGVLVMDAALAAPLASIPLTVGEAGFDNPQGLAVSPDGELLLVSDGLPGGAATLLRTADHAVVHRFAMAEGRVPLGVAFSADGAQALVLEAVAAGGPGRLLRFDVAGGTRLDAVTVGARPTAVTVSPDGRTAFVTNQADGTLSRLDLVAPAVTATAATDAGPTGLAFAPDGVAVIVVHREGGSVALHAADSGQPSTAPLPLDDAVGAVAVDPMGQSAVVGLSRRGALQALGGTRSLSVQVGGTGSGTVTSSPPGILCGTSCTARFPAGTQVRLTAVADSQSFVGAWTGDPACAGGLVTLEKATTCVASFVSTASLPTFACCSPCFIATAAYGSPMAAEVHVLRGFRDRHLRPHAVGRLLVAGYEWLSPPLADAIRPHPAARAVVRGVLWPVVAAVREPVAAAVVVTGLMLACVWALRWRRRSRAGSSVQTGRPG